jgi:uncharacterized glyoxalase superfamily protein PhnB
MAVDHTLQMNPYLSFKGECEAAFKLYERCLGGMVVDRFGIPWLVNSEGDQSTDR